MHAAAREAILSIPESHLKVAKAAEVELYAHALSLHLKLLSPLDVAVSCSKAKRYRHVELLNAWIMAQMEGRLYFDGPGPEPVPLTKDSENPLDISVVGWTGEDLPSQLSDLEPEDLELILSAEAGQAFDDAGRLILVHPTRGDRPVYNLAISMPPRHGKSFLVSEHLPVWFLANYPQYSCLLASYEATFAATWGGKVRDHIVEHPEFGINVTGGRGAAKMHFDLDGHRGFMKCAGVGGPLTGSGGQLIVVDDPIKNAEEAMSATIREAAEAWWHSTLYTRREPWEDGTPGRVILMATRWHEDDLNGKMVPETPEIGDRWAKINLMAIWTPNDEEPVDLLGREEGQALCPQRFTSQDLIDIRDGAEEGRVWFEALYQGHPALDEGNLITRPFNYYELTLDETGKNGIYTVTDQNGAVSHIREKDCYRFGTMDVAGTDTKRSDYTVLAVFDVTTETPRRAFLRAIERVRITTEHHENLTKKWYKKYDLRAVHVEDKQYGTNLIRRLMGVPGLIVAKLKADTNKIHRAMPVKYEISGEMLWFPKNADWLIDFEREVTKFPKTTHDDQVDALAYGVQVYKGMPQIIVKPKEPVTMEERVEAHRKELAAKNKRAKKLRVRGGWQL
jgi:predicted phage terminase large subunit-like protein